MAPMLSSGDVRYDPVSGDEMQLVHAFKSEKPRVALWSVVLPDGTVKVLDLAGRRSRKRPFVGAGRYKTVAKFSNAEWSAIEARSLALKEQAPAGLEVLGTALQAPLVGSVAGSEAGSEAASDAGDLVEDVDVAGEDGAGVSDEPLRRDPPATPAPARAAFASARPARVSAPSAAGWPSISLLQVRTYLTRVIPGVVLILGGLAYSFPRAWKVLTKGGALCYKAGEKAFGVLEKMSEWPAEAWSLIAVLLGLLYLLETLIGLRAIWRWLYEDDATSEADRVRQSQAFIRGARSDPRGLMRERTSMARDGSRSAGGGVQRGDDGWGEVTGIPRKPMGFQHHEHHAAHTHTEASREKELTGDLIAALQSVSSRLERLETRPESSPAGAPGKVTPSSDREGLDEAPDLDLLAALKQRAGAFDEMTRADRGSRLPDDAKPVSGVTGSESETDRLLRELKESQEQAESRIQDPLVLLKQQQLKPINMLGAIKTRIAPTYLTYAYHKNRSLSLYFESYFSQRSLLKTALYGECSRLASTIDNLVYNDSCEVFNSVGVERMCRRLYGCELALKDVTSQNTLSKAEWALADELDLNTVEGIGYQPTSALEEVDKRLQRRSNTLKWLNKSQPTGGPKEPKKTD